MKLNNLLILILVILLSSCSESNKTKQTSTNNTEIAESKKKKIEAVINLISDINHTKAELLGVDQSGKYLIIYKDGLVEHSIKYDGLNGDVYENGERRYNALKVKVFKELLSKHENNSVFFSGVEDKNKLLKFSFSGQSNEDSSNLLLMDENNGNVFGPEGKLLFNLFMEK